MLQLPPIPAWNSLHPLVVHFPIALLLVAPLFIVLGTLLRSASRRTFLIAALVLMVCGTLATFLAVATGEAAGEVAENRAGVKATLEQHEELAESLRAVFAVLTIAFAALLFAPRLLHRQPTPSVQAGLVVAFLLCYAGGAILLANTAHQGGRLVHELGVTTAISGAAPAAVTPAAKGGDDHD